MRSAILSVLFTILLGSWTANANLITNGGFETGNFNGWTISGTGTFGNDYGITVNGPISGQYAAWFGRSTNWTYISQDIPTIIGQEYDVSFYILINNRNQTPNNGGEIICGPIQMQGFNQGSMGWNMLETTFIATSALTHVEFGFYNATGWWNLDNVSVEPVPEPSTIVLLGLGIAALTVCHGKHRKR
jgi:hypothetical protein